jgi:hypothetical protein
MKGTARILNLPDSMKDTHDLIDGKVVRKAGVRVEDAVKRYKPQKQHVGVRGILAVVALILATIGWTAIASITDEEILDKVCLSSLELEDYQSFTEFDCANRSVTRNKFVVPRSL